MQDDTLIINRNDGVLVTGAAGFIGSRVVSNLVERGFTNVRCLVRGQQSRSKLEALCRSQSGKSQIDVQEGNLLWRDDCLAATRGISIIYHLAAGRGAKSFPDAFMNSVVTTRNLLDACRAHDCLKRFVNIGSLSVYSNRHKPRKNVLDESCPVDAEPRGDAYSYAKVKQDEIVRDYGDRFGLPFVIVRPGVVFGPGNEGIHGRVGIGTFGLFLHLGGGNPVPFTYLDNCADAIVLAGLVPGIAGEVINVVDDAPLSSRRFLRLYKRHVRPFKSLYVPHAVSYFLCRAWERYSEWSQGQLPPVFGQRTWHVYWKRTHYSNAKAKTLLKWSPGISQAEALRRHFDACRRVVLHA